MVEAEANGAEDKNEASKGKGADGQEEASRPAGPSCEVCHKLAAKYRCPACDLRSCCLDCVQAHKQHTGCSGKRARTKRVAPLNSFTDEILLRDYGLLEDVDAAVDRANRDLRIRDEELRLFQPRRHKQRIDLARACAAPERQTRLILAPFAMSLARENSSRVVEPGGKGKRKGKGKGKGKKGQSSPAPDPDAKPAYIAWRVDWHFLAAGQVLTDKGLPEHEVVGRVLDRFLQNSCPWGPTRHLLLKYVEQGLENLEVFLQQPQRTRQELKSWSDMRREAAEEDEADSEEEPPLKRPESSAEQGVRLPPPPPPPPPVPALPESASEESEESEDESPAKAETAVELNAEPYLPFVRLDKARTLRENLMERSIVEHPVLHVALPEECSHYLQA
mmetsp:Transcript_1654/g.3964  ORF Transcript_1654/g.3964 Transcript_1654/m.3964 type:complete len:391 (+) Transcript_1654:47-1219(+)